MKRGLHVGNNKDGSRIEVPFDEVAKARALELQAEVRAYVDSVLPRDDREIALADYCDLLLALIGGGPVDGEAATALMAKKNFTLRARKVGDKAQADCDACKSVDELARVAVDLDVIGVP